MISEKGNPEPDVSLNSLPSSSVLHNTFSGSSISLLSQGVTFEKEVFEQRGNRHEFERITGRSGLCIFCKESVGFLSVYAYYCPGNHFSLLLVVCEGIAHTKCYSKVPDTCRVPTGL